MVAVEQSIFRSCIARIGEFSISGILALVGLPYSLRDDQRSM